MNYQIEVFDNDNKIGTFNIIIKDDQIAFVGDKRFIFQFMKRLGSNSIHETLFDTLEALITAGKIGYGKWKIDGLEFRSEILVYRKE